MLPARTLSFSPCPPTSLHCVLNSHGAWHAGGLVGRVALRRAATTVAVDSPVVEEQTVRNAINDHSRVLVVGASRGIGLEFVRQLADKGAQVVASYRGSEPPAALQAIADGKENQVGLVSMDVTDPASVAAAAEQARKLLKPKGTLTHIIHNAGVYGKQVSLDGMARYGRSASPPVDKQTMLDVFEVNAVGPMLVAQAFLPLLQPMSMSKPLPVVSFLSSKVGSVDDNGSGGAYAYRASKSALNICAKSLSVDLRGRANVVLLHPGYVRTDMTNGEGLIDVDESVTGLMRAIEATDDAVPFRWVDYKACIVPW